MLLLLSMHREVQKGAPRAHSEREEVPRSPSRMYLASPSKRVILLRSLSTFPSIGSEFLTSEVYTANFFTKIFPTKIFQGLILFWGNLIPSKQELGQSLGKQTSIYLHG